jgi:aminoglycoside phosphotransferase (APT) family kinase protein
MSIDSVTELIEAARRAGLELAPVSDAFDTMGLDFLVVHAVDPAGVRWIVRTPRRPDVLASTRVEANVLALVRPRLPVAVPDWRVHTDEVIAYPRLAGTPAVTLDTGAPQWNLIDPAAPSAAFIESIAQAFAAMQRISVAEAREAGAPTKTTDEERPALARAIEITKDALQPSAAILERWQRWLANDAMWPAHLALSHGDLHPGHMLLADDGRLSGILDWTEAKLGDPSIDVAMFFGCFGRGPTEALVARMTALGVATWPGLVDHAAERWAFGPVAGAEWALRTDNPAVLDFARGQLAALTTPAS